MSVESAAMWNLTGDDIQRVKEKLVGRRAAIKARYDDEMKKLEADIAAIETFERAAVDFVANYKGEDGPETAIAAPEPAAEKAGADSAAEESRSPGTEPAAGQSAEAEIPPSPEAAATEKGASRWRVRLGATQGSP